MASRVSAGRAAIGQHLRGEGADLGPLHLGVLELAEAVLQRLELPDGLPSLRRVVQGPEHLHKVAQFLAALAQVMQALRQATTR